MWQYLEFLSSNEFAQCLYYITKTYDQRHIALFGKCDGLDIAILKCRYAKESSPNVCQMSNGIKSRELDLSSAMAGSLADPSGRGVVEFSCAEVKVTRAL